MYILPQIKYNHYTLPNPMEVLFIGVELDDKSHGNHDEIMISVTCY